MPRRHQADTKAIEDAIRKAARQVTREKDRLDREYGSPVKANPGGRMETGTWGRQSGWISNTPGGKGRAFEFDIQGQDFSDFVERDINDKPVEKIRSAAIRARMERRQRDAKYKKGYRNRPR